MTGLLDRMERDGLVARMADPNDRRAQRIFLTQTGRDVQQPIRRIVEITLESVFDGINDQEISKTADFLRRVLANVNKGIKP
jgi:DNA-binding MarR family transcriptional regulator